MDKDVVWGDPNVKWDGDTPQTVTLAELIYFAIGTTLIQSLDWNLFEWNEENKKFIDELRGLDVETMTSEQKKRLYKMWELIRESA